MSQKSGKRSRRRTEEESENVLQEDAKVVSNEKAEIVSNNSEVHLETKTTNAKEKVEESPSETPNVKESSEKKQSNNKTGNKLSTPNKRKNATQSQEPENITEEINADNEKTTEDNLNTSLHSIQEETEIELKISESSEKDNKDEDSPVLQSKVKKIKSAKRQSCESEKTGASDKQPYVSLIRMEDVEEENLKNAPSSTEKSSEENQLKEEEKTEEEIKKHEESSENVVSNGHDESCDSYASESIADNDFSTAAMYGSKEGMAARSFEFSLLDNSHSSAFLNLSKDQSLVDTCRKLSSRRSIRPLSDDIRKRAFRNNFEGRDYFDSPYPSRYSVERITGSKRKRHSTSPPDSKRARTDYSLFSYFSRPISNLKRKMSRSDLQSSTPKLTGYKNTDEGFETKNDQQNLVGEDLEKKWCSIM